MTRSNQVAHALLRAVSRLVSTPVCAQTQGVGTSAGAAARGSACATLLFAVALAGCSAPEPTGVKAIVGARLDPGEGKPAIEYSVVVIADGKIRAVGPQATTPVPKGAELSDGKGRVIHGPLEVGKPADLVLHNAATGSVEAVIKNGEWMK